MSGQFDECTYCESALPTDEWCPVLTSEEDGRLVVHSFCDDDCKDAWLAEQEDDA